MKSIALTLNKINLPQGIFQRFCAVTIANIIMAFSVDLLRLAAFGNDPFSCMHLGFGIASGLTYGTCVIIFNLVMIIPIIIFERQFIQVGTLVNMFLLGPAADFWMNILNLFVVEPVTFEMRVAFLISGVIISCWGVSLYFCSNLGMGPYDCIGWIVERRTNKKIPFKYARIILDVTAVSIGFTLGSIVGIGTIIMACCTGPLVTFFSEKVNQPLLDKFI